MNKQATAFLTMFSLILMLSVYYVTLPLDTQVVMKGEEPIKEEPQPESTEETSTSKKQEEIYQQNSIVSDQNSTQEEKQTALQTIEQLKSEMQLQEDLSKALTEAGFQNNVQIQEQVCKVEIIEGEDNEDNAKKAMELAYDVVEGQYFVEVSFK